MDCGMKCIKFLVFIFNLLFALSGLIILIVGAVIQAGYREYLEFVPHEIFSAPMILIAVGVVIFVIAFFGCCGAMKENNCMVLTFAVLLGIIFIVEISAGIAAYVMRSELEGRISERMTESMGNYKWEEGTDNIVTSSWNVVQHELHCCGVDTYADWKNYTDTSKTGYPPTCCAELPQGQKCEKVTYEEGCLKKLSDHIKSNVSIIGGVGIGIAFVQLIGIVFACCLSKSIRRDYETV